MAARRRRSVLLGSVMPLVLALGLVGGVRAADGEFVANGAFDTDLAGWTVPVSGGCGNTAWVAAGNPGGSAWMNACGEADSDPSIEQALTDLVIGETYQLAGEYQSVAPGVGDPAKPDAFEVELDGDVILSLPRPAGDPTAWTAFGVQFTATATTHTIAFYAERDGDDSDFAIDNISVVGETEAGVTPTPTASVEPTAAVTLPPTDTAAPTMATTDGLGGILAGLGLLATLVLVVTLTIRPTRRSSR
jgi:hypothetical protein